MKKIFALFFACLLMFGMLAPMAAYEFEAAPLVDIAGYLDDLQFEALSEKLETIRSFYEFDVAIVTEYEMSGPDIETTACDIYDYGGYGAGEDFDGILLYICAETDEYYIVTSGWGVELFSDAELDYIIEALDPYFMEGDYVSFMNVFAETTEEILVTAYTYEGSDGYTDSYDPNVEEPYEEEAYMEGFVNPPVIDLAGYVEYEQLLTLTEKFDKIRAEHHMEVAVYTEEEMTSSDAMSSADDVYDYGGFGYGENRDGIMLYICSGTREYHITTCGDGIRVFNDNGLIYIEEQILPYLQEDDYYGAMDAFADVASELLVMAANGEVYNEGQKEESNPLIIVIAAILIPLIIAWLMMKAKLSQMKTAVENNYAANYIKPGSKILNISRDIFLYSHVTKTERPKNDSGGSSTHRSSSGSTHGGRGGSF